MTDDEREAVVRERRRLPGRYWYDEDVDFLLARLDAERAREATSEGDRRCLADRALHWHRRAEAFEAVLVRFLVVEGGACGLSAGGTFCHAHDFALPCPVADARQLLGGPSP